MSILPFIAKCIVCPQGTPVYDTFAHMSKKMKIVDRVFRFKIFLKVITVPKEQVVRLFNFSTRYRMLKKNISCLGKHSEMGQVFVLKQAFQAWYTIKSHDLYSEAFHLQQCSIERGLLVIPVEGCILRRHLLCSSNFLKKCYLSYLSNIFFAESDIPYEILSYLRGWYVCNRRQNPKSNQKSRSIKIDEPLTPL